MTQATVEIVGVRLDETVGDVPLDEAERQQADRFLVPDDRRRYIAAHAALRTVLGRRLGVAPSDVRFARAPQGKPRLAAAALDLRFNLSHSGERALIAVTDGREIGVDIERIRPMRDMRAVAERFFSPFEIAQLAETPQAHRHECFFRIWTRKESFIKARGDGLRFPLDGFDVAANAAGGPQLLRGCAASPEDMTRWTIRALPCAAGYAAAFTVEGAADDLIVATAELTW